MPRHPSNVAMMEPIILPSNSATRNAAYSRPSNRAMSSELSVTLGWESEAFHNSRTRGISLSCSALIFIGPRLYPGMAIVRRGLRRGKDGENKGDRPLCPHTNYVASWTWIVWGQSGLSPDYADKSSLIALESTNNEV